MLEAEDITTKKKIVVQFKYITCWLPEIFITGMWKHYWSLVKLKILT